MKKYLKALVAVAFLAIICNRSMADGIEFNHGSWEQVKEEAKSEHKLIFIDFYTSWCAPCKFMAQTIFPLKEVGDFYNKNFVCVQIDAEKGEGIALAHKYGVNAYPTMMFTNEKEEVIHRALGSSTADEFIGQGKIALTASPDELADLKDKYLKNEMTKDELYKYFLRVKAAGNDKETSEVFDKYFALDANVSADMFNTISANVYSPDSKAFIYLEQHRDEFANLAGKEKVDNFIRKTYIEDVEYNKFKSDEEYQAAMAKLKTKVNLTEKEELNIDANYYCTTKDKDRYMAAASKLATDYYYLTKDDFQLSNLIGGASRFDLTKDEWLTVKAWAEHALAIKDNALNNASLAIVYKSMKDKEQALKYINKSLEDCQRDKETYASRIEMFKKEIEDATY